MKNKWLYILCFLGLSLVSCQREVIIQSSSSESSSEMLIRDDIYDKNAKLDSFTLKDLDNNTVKEAPLSSLGEQKILVLPILFSDSSLSINEQNKIHADLEDAFFGESEDTGWESLSSFYHKSSYGKLDIKGEVAPFVTLDLTLEEAASLNAQTSEYVGINPYYYDRTYYPLLRGLELLEASDPTFDRKEYDQNKDGYIDGVWLIYGEKEYSAYFEDHGITATDPLYNTLSNYLWAYTYWYMGALNYTKPSPRTYCWASYNFMYTEGFSSVDAHTFIHETGHMMGLDDYYNYDTGSMLSTGGRDYTRPTGGLDMMDCNIGDHNAFSKYLLSWVEPKIVVKEGTYTLESFQKNGDCLIIPSSSWNGSPYQEYLIIEYYTPTGLNSYDSINAYQGVYPKLFSKPGFKIYHVDARVGGFTKSQYQYINDPTTYDKFLGSSSAFLGMMNSNTPSRNKNESTNGYQMRLITLLSGTGRNTYFRNAYASNNDLYTEGRKLEKYSFHNSSNLSIKLEIGTCDNEKGVITFY